MVLQPLARHVVLATGTALLGMALSSCAARGGAPSSPPPTPEAASRPPAVVTSAPATVATAASDAPTWVAAVADGTACAGPAVRAGTRLRRAPYLQSSLQSSVRVAFTATDAQSARVRYGRVGDERWREVGATVEDFPASRTGDVVDYRAFDAALVGLEAGTRYCYEVVVDGQRELTGATFETAWTTHDRPLRLIAVGDSGTGEREQRELAAQMQRSSPDIFVHLGDMAYPAGRFRDFEIGVFGVYAPMMVGIPMWPAVGNHEYRTQSARPYRDVYYLPEQALRPGEQELYYSFDYGNVHFVSLDSNDERAASISDAARDDMLDWLVTDLSGSDADWKIVFLHHPVWSSGAHGSTPWLQRSLIPLLDAGGVDLVLAGHDHHYERTIPLTGGARAEDPKAAVTYVVAGAGGAELRRATGDWFTAARNDTVHNYLELVIDGCVATGRALDATGAELDSFTLDGCE